MFRILSIGILPLISLAVIGFVIFDIFYTGKYASTSSKIFWVVVMIFAPIVLPVAGIVVWILYPFIGHKSLLKESLETLEKAQTLNQPGLPQAHVIDALDSMPLTSSDQQPLHQPAQSIGLYNQETIEKFKTTTSVVGGILSVVMIFAGVALIGFMVLIAVVMYQCSRPGAKCM
jgi:hypothetical protein